MKKIVKILTLTAAISCALYATTTPASSQSTQTNCPQETKSNKRLSLLFVFQVSHASLKHVKANRYSFYFPTNKKDKVLAFSDRPNRIAFPLTRDAWASLIMQGKNNFKVDPPNLVLTWEGSRGEPIAYEVAGFKRNATGVTYTLDALTSVQATDRQGAASIYMDDVYAGFDCTTRCTTSYLEEQEPSICTAYTFVCDNICPDSQTSVNCSTL